MSMSNMADNLEQICLAATHDKNPEVFNDVLLDNTIVDIIFGRSIGKQEFYEGYDVWNSTFEHSTLEIQDTMTAQNAVILKVEQQLIHDNNFMGIRPTGKKVTVDGIYIFSTDAQNIGSNKLTNIYGTLNVHSMLVQMGFDGTQSIFIPPTTWRDKVNAVSHELNKLSKNISLTPREIECLCLYLTCKSAKEIGQILGISPRTAETHISRLMLKCDCNSKTELFNLVNDRDNMHLIYDLQRLLIGDNKIT